MIAITTSNSISVKAPPLLRLDSRRHSALLFISPKLDFEYTQAPGKARKNSVLWVLLPQCHLQKPAWESQTLQFCGDIHFADCSGYEICGLTFPTDLGGGGRFIQRGGRERDLWNLRDPFDETIRGRLRRAAVFVANGNGSGHFCRPALAWVHMTLLIATRNQHKVEEIRACLGAGFRFLTLLDFPDAPVSVEDGSTFAANATKKAVALAKWLAQFPLESARTFVLADDSGLEVNALGGAPGVHSARFAALDCVGGANSTDAENNAKLLRLLVGVPESQRTARFRCAIALDVVRCGSSASIAPEEPTPAWLSCMPLVVEGACEGRILDAPRGMSGFGYDPLFLPTGYAETFAELGEEVKNRISHRARALEKLRRWIADQALFSGSGG